MTSFYYLYKRIIAFAFRILSVDFNEFLLVCIALGVISNS